MHSNHDLIRKFYTVFNSKDAETMVSLYDDKIIFSDPAFGTLQGDNAKNMWRMLCGRATDLEITCSDIQADEINGSARWEARYTFGKTKRRVHNVIKATFEFKNGLIVKHTDVFDIWKWSRMALGPAGILLGWTPWLQSKIRKDALKGLKAFSEKQNK
ncbi:nuclear transport factor 2 family protein [bacterium]|nr:nuclear transport factor 2 family protein [bacterium]